MGTFIVSFTQKMILKFTIAKFHEIKKVSKLLNALMNQAKNHQENRSRLKNITSAERYFLEDLKKNEDSCQTLKDPQAKYYNVVLANFIYFMNLSECIKFQTSSDLIYDTPHIDSLKDRVIDKVFGKADMNFNLQHASEFVNAP